jgi:predicted regulator of Ras-like GTPase activity (Roadblock/LC7/MglB family)
MATGLAEALQELQVTNGLDLAAIVTSDGLVVDAAGSADVDTESICSVASNGLLMMEALAQELGEAQADITTLEYAGHTVVMSPMDDENLLVLLAGAGMNLGRLRIILRRRREELVSLLQQD